MKRRLQWIGVLFLCAVCLRGVALLFFPDSGAFRELTLQAFIVMTVVVFLALGIGAVVLLFRWLRNR